MSVWNCKKYLKLVSYVACFSILFPPTFVSVQAFSLFGKAEKSIPISSVKNVVSILIEKDLLGYSGVKRKIERYAEDVQKATQSQVVMMAVPQETSVKEIQEGNAALYFSGIEQDEKSQLIGTILIGDVPLPVVSQNGRPYVSPWPYSDFEDPEYVWNNTNKQFEYVGGDRNPEIWQGLIRPTATGSSDEEKLEKRAEMLEEYFEKNNAFHKGNIEYGKKVFHANLPFQKNGISDLMRQSYESYIKNIEDIKYLRYTKELAQELFEDQKIDEIIDLDLIESVSSDQPEMDFENIPDIFSKNVIEKLQRRYVELYEGYISNLNTKIEQSGRWDARTVETTFSLVTRKDEAAANILKKFNDAIERKMFSALVTANIPAEISIPKGGTLRVPTCATSPSYTTGRSSATDCVLTGVTNYLYFPDYWNGIKIEDFGNSALTFDGKNVADQCSLLRGSGVNGKTVEFNRAFSFENINTSETTDDYFCDADNLVRACGQIVNSQLQTSQANFSDMSRFEYQATNNKWDISGDNDIVGKLDDVGNNENFYKFYLEQAPLLDLAAGKVRTNTNVGASGCKDLIWEKNSGKVPGEVHDDIEDNLQTFSSLVNHIEPTTLTIREQFSKVTTSPAFDLPVDNPRGVSFYDASFDFQKISYPNIFDLRKKFVTNEDRATSLANEIQNILNQKVLEINAVSTSGNELSTAVLLDELENFEIGNLVESLIWLDKSIEEKNEYVFLAALKDTNTAKKELGNTNFNGFEVLQLFGESNESILEPGIKVDFERTVPENSLVFTEAEIKDLSFQYELENDSTGMFSDIFSDANTNNSENANNLNGNNNGNTGCNRNLLQWSGSCLVPWLSDLPNAFSKFSQLIASETETGEIGTTVVSNEASSEQTNSEQTSTESVAKITSSQQKIIMNQSVIMPQKITVELLNATNEILENDFSSLVTMKLPTSFKANGEVEKVVRNGKANFFFTPEKNISVGTHSIIFETQNGKKLTIPFVITNDELQAAIDFPRMEAGEIKGAIITVWAKERKNITRKYDGTTINFSAVLGRFSNNGKAVFKNGKAEITFFPGTKASTENIIEISHEKLAPDSLQTEIYPAKLSQVLYKTNSKFFIRNDLVSKEITAILADRFGNEIEAESMFEWNVNDVDIQKETKNSITVSLQKLADKNNVWVTAETDLLEQKSTKNQFVIIENPILEIKKYLTTFVAGDKRKASIFIETKNNKGELLVGDFVASIEMDNELAGTFPALVSIKNGVGEILFKPGVIAGNYTGKILIDGFAPVIFSFEIQASAAKKIEINKSNLVRSAKSEKEIIEIEIKDVFGNRVKNFDENVYAQLNPIDILANYVAPSWFETIESIELITTDGDKNFYGIKIPVTNGIGKLELFPKNISGQLQLLVQQENLVPSTALFDFSNTLVPKDFNFLQPQSLFTILRGWQSFDFGLKSIANEFLFNGNSQVVLGSITKENTKKMIGWVHPNGKKSENFETKLKEGAVPIIEFFKEDQKVAHLETQFSTIPEIQLESNINLFENEGIYIQVSTAEQQNFEFQKYQLWYKDTPLISFRKNGGIQILNSEININGTNSWNKFEVVTKNEIPNFSLQFVHKKLDLKDLITSDFDLENTPVLNSTNKDLGVLILDSNQKEVSNRKIVENTSDVSDLDWVGTQKTATLFAAKNSAGKSWKFSSSPNMFLFGDPTISVITKNQTSALKLTKDLGVPIWKNPTGVAINQILASDLNLDGQKEIFSLIGDTLNIQYADPELIDTYRDTGPILRFADGVKKLATYDLENNLKYLIQINEEGALNFFENKLGVLSKTSKKVALDRVWVDIKIGNINKDKFLDLILLDENNTLYFVHGKASGEFYAPTKLYSFFSEINTANEFFSPNNLRADHPEDNTHEYLSSFYVSFLKQNQSAAGDINILDVAFQSLTTNKSIRFDFKLTPQAKALVGKTVTAELELMPLQAVRDVQIVIPEIEGMVLNEKSFSCQGCNKNVDPISTSYGTLIKNISGLVGKKQTISWEYKILSVPRIEYLVDDFSGKDAIDDVAIPWTDELGNRQLVLFKSDGLAPRYPVNVLDLVQTSLFKKVNNFLRAQSIEQQETTRLKTHTLSYESAFSNNDYSNLETSDLIELSENGLNSLVDLAFDEESVEDLIAGMSCGSGACGLQIPSYVFMGPGQQSLYLPPISLPSIPTLPIPQVGLPALQIIPSIPFVLPFTPTVPASTFRLFVMPSITGQVGIAACLGLQATSSLAPLPIGNCFTFVPKISAFGSCDLDDGNSGLIALEAAYNFANTGSYTPPTVKETKNKKLISADVITAWVQAQFEEFSNFKFPSINFVLPKFSATNPTNSDSVWGKLAQSQFLKVEKRIVDIAYPSFSKDELNGLKDGWTKWKTSYTNWKSNTTKNLSADTNFKQKLQAPLSALKVKTSINLIGETAKSLPGQIKAARESLSAAEKEIFDTEISKNVAALKSALKNSRSLVADAAETDPKMLETFNTSVKSITDLEKTIVPDIDMNMNVSLPDFKLDSSKLDKITKELGSLVSLQPLETLVTDFEKNIDTLETYKTNETFLKEFPKKIENLSSQIGETTNLVNDYFSEWQKENQKREREWKIFRVELETTLNAWKSISKVFSGLTQQCPTCTVNRGTVISWFLKVILGSINLPVISLPKSPDITIDLSKVGVGLTMIVPDIQLTPTPLKLPNIAKDLPSLDSNLFIPAITELLEQKIPLISVDVSANGKTFAKKIIDSAVNFSKQSIGLDGGSINLESINVESFNFSDSLNLSLNTSFDSVWKSLPLTNFNITPNIPNIPLLIGVPDFSQIQFDLDVPSIDLPQLPLILPPPILPNFLAPLQKILAIPKPFFNLFCYLILGVIPVPEWKLASHVQEKTNRFSLTKILDFAPGALLKSPPKPDEPDERISFNGVYPEALETLNKQLNQLEVDSKCSVQSLSGEECEEGNDTVASASKTEGEEVITVVFDGKNTILNSKTVRQNKILEKKLWIEVQKSKNELENNTKKLLAEISKTPKKKVLSNLLASNQPVSPESVKNSLKQVSTFVEPTVSYFDSNKNISETVFNYNLIGRNFTSLVVDLEKDRAEEILYAIEDELFLKRRVVPKSQTNVAKNIIKWNIEDLESLFIPTENIDTNTYANGADVELSVLNPTIKYYEWNLSNRPDVLWEQGLKTKDRMSTQWNRVGMLIRSDIQKYQVRPSSAQITAVTGEPKLTAPKRQILPNFEDRSACTDTNIEKPFFATESLLLGTKDNTTFRIETKKRKGEAPKSFWKRINKGEEILVDFAEVCVISGDIEIISYDEPTTFAPSVGDYFPTSSLIETNENSSVSLLIDGIYDIKISNGETYTIETFTNETKFVSGFKSLKTGNSYGVLTALNKDNESAVLSKLLHDPQGEDDTESPTIILKNGTNITEKLFTPITIDASKSFDNVAIQDITWQSEGFDFSKQKTLNLLIPAQASPTTLEIELTITDGSNNSSTENITLEIEEATANIIKATTSEIFITANTKAPLNLFRERVGTVKNILPNFSLNSKNQFQFIPKNESDAIEIWQLKPRKKLAEIFSTGRILILDTDTEIKIEAATKNSQGLINLQKKDQTKIVEIKISFGEKLEISNTNTDADIFVEDLLSTDNFKWTFFDSSVIGFKNTVALVNTKTKEMVFMIDEKGNFYNPKKTFDVKIAAGGMTDPLKFVLKNQQQDLVASFQLSSFDLVVE